MKALLQKMGTMAMLLLLCALSVVSLTAAVAPELVASFADALRLHRKQDLRTLEGLTRQVLRPPPGPIKRSGTSSTTPAFSGEK